MPTNSYQISNHSSDKRESGYDILTGRTPCATCRMSEATDLRSYLGIEKASIRFGSIANGGSVLAGRTTMPTMLRLSITTEFEVTT